MEVSAANGSRRVMFAGHSGFFKSLAWKFRLSATCCLVLCCSSASAYGDYSYTGGVNYEMGAQSLEDMYVWVLTMLVYVRDLLMAIAAITLLYNAVGVYIKMQTGEGGIVKSIMLMVGACIFMGAIMIVLPSFFGYNYGSAHDLNFKFW